MKIIPGEYDVALSKAKIAHFINKKFLCNIGLH